MGEKCGEYFVESGQLLFHPKSPKVKEDEFGNLSWDGMLSGQACDENLTVRKYPFLSGNCDKCGYASPSASYRQKEGKWKISIHEAKENASSDASPSPSPSTVKSLAFHPDDSIEVIFEKKIARLDREIDEAKKRIDALPDDFNRKNELKAKLEGQISGWDAFEKSEIDHLRERLKKEKEGKNASFKKISDEISGWKDFEKSIREHLAGKEKEKEHLRAKMELVINKAS